MYGVMTLFTQTSKTCILFKISAILQGSRVRKSTKASGRDSVIASGHTVRTLCLISISIASGTLEGLAPT